MAKDVIVILLHIFFDNVQNQMSHTGALTLCMQCYSREEGIQIQRWHYMKVRRYQHMCQCSQCICSFSLQPA